MHLRKHKLEFLKEIHRNLLLCKIYFLTPAEGDPVLLSHKSAVLPDRVHSASNTPEMLSRSSQKHTSEDSEDRQSFPHQPGVFDFQSAVDRVMHKPRSKFSRAATLPPLHEALETVPDKSKDSSVEEDFPQQMIKQKIELATMSHIEQPNIKTLCQPPDLDEEDAGSQEKAEKKTPSSSMKTPVEQKQNRKRPRASHTTLQLFGQNAGSTMMMDIRNKPQQRGSDDEENYQSSGSQDRGGVFSLYGGAEVKQSFGEEPPRAQPEPSISSQPEKKKPKQGDKRKLEGKQLLRIAPKVHF